MEFPITRERLQNYRMNEDLKAEAKQLVSKEIVKICKDVEGTVLSTNEHKYVYRIPSRIKYPNLRTSNQVILPQPVGILKELVAGIKDTFPDSDIIVDLLETYVIIDWSYR
jgi:hypothetical protein